VTARELQAALARRCSRDALLRQLRDWARLTEHELWLVGGYVRDTALRARPYDVDLVVVRRARSCVAALQRLWRTKGVRFRKRGITTWRFSTHARLVDLVIAERRGLDADLSRRDLTINAMAYELNRERLYDPLRGLTDLKAARLRLPHPGVIGQDPLRALRAARFLAGLPRFSIARSALAPIRSAAQQLHTVAPERVRAELHKLLGGVAPQRGLEALFGWGLLEPLLPELAGLPHCIAGADRPDIWRHTVDAVGLSATRRAIPGADAIADDERPLLRWALLLHDISKPETLAFDAAGRPSFHGHEVLGARRADRLLRRLRMSGKQRKRISRLILHHLRPGHLADSGASPRGLRRLVRDSADDLHMLTAHAACDALASGSPNAKARWLRLRRVLLGLLEQRRLQCHSPLPTLVSGNDVMRLGRLAAGPRVGQLLQRVSEAQRAGRITTRDEALHQLELWGRAGRDSPANGPAET